MSIDSFGFSSRDGMPIGDGDSLRLAGHSLLEYGDRLLAEDKKKVKRDLTVLNPKPQGNWDVKRFRFGSTIKFKCKFCGATQAHRLEEIPLSYPDFNIPFTYTCYCDECRNEWQATTKLVLHVELQECDT